MKVLFKTLGILSEAELNMLDEVIAERTLKKNDYLIEQHSVCTEIVFIKSGALRSFYINNEGEEITNCIAFENELMSAFSSFITQKSTDENIQAIFDTELEVLKQDDLERLYNKSSNWQKAGRILVEMQYVQLEKRIASFQKFTGKERYEELFTRQPDYIRRIPLQYLASFLGITPRHLSRIRKAV